MPFTIPSNDLAGVPARQSVWYDTDIAILVAGFLGTGVLTGCGVTAQGSPDMTLAVAAGTIQPSAGVAAVTVTSGNVTITTAHATLPRIDLVTASAAGVKTVTAGTAAGEPKPPNLPSGHVGLAMVDVPAADTAIQTAQITSKAVVLVAGSAGGVATDPLWDAAGDLAVGSGADTAAKLTKGSDGQVLTVDPTTHLLVWATPSGGSIPVTTKGDLFGYSSAAARIPVGSDTQVLTADSTQALGLKWAAPGGGGTLLACHVYEGTISALSSATAADLSATDAAVTFTAPASGNVLVRLSAIGGAGTTLYAILAWGLRESTTNVKTPNAVTRAATTTSMLYGVTSVFVVTGVSAGSHTYKWSYSITAGGTDGFVAGSLVMEVWALP